MIQLLAATLAILSASADTSSQRHSPPEHEHEYASAEYDFSPERWTRGLHLLAGIGINTSRFRSDTDLIRGGFGLNIKTDLGWYFDSEKALELGVIVNFNTAEDLLIWQSVLTAGLRMRFPGVSYSERSAPYLKPFIGYGPEVVFFRETLPVVNGQEAERTHNLGPAAGINLGLFKKGSSGIVWFIELTGMIQWLHKTEYVRNEGEIPIVIERARRNDEAKQSTAFVTVGLLAF